jgi:hypothetical protein
VGPNYDEGTDTLVTQCSVYHHIRTSTRIIENPCVPSSVKEHKYACGICLLFNRCMALGKIMSVKKKTFQDVDHVVQVFKK